ncbi:MAG: TatD family hydrolase [Candidatus Heimdallarchaeota archaeon]|nr:TatD family hydrolase [Candidatus Heimdallarchaeota archaeon]
MVNEIFIDAHCHLVEPYFKQADLGRIINEAAKVGVKKIVNCASDPAQYEQCLQSLEFENVSINLGIQPTIAGDVIGAEILVPYLDKISAIGEVGLDYHWVKQEKDRQRQEEVFIECIQLANEHDLPLVIHSRKAEKDCVSLLEQHADVPVLLHSFEGNLELIKLSLDSGYIISIPTNVVIRRNRRKVAQRAGIENIILETDSPYCAPSEEIFPNTPSTIPIAAEKIAELFEVPINELASITTNTAKRFFKI